MENKPRVVCYGEILWDNLPSGKKPGGAPMNVAYHLHQLQVDCALISRIGSDKNGRELLAFLETKGINARFCQVDSLHPTSTVEVTITEDNEAIYTIVEDVAWDYIEFRSELQQLTLSSDAFVFGSLTARSIISNRTLVQLLENAKYKVFDVNLREPYFNRENIEALLQQTNLLKLNLSELNKISDWFGTGIASEAERIKVLQNGFGISEILVTKGSSGASFYTQADSDYCPAVKVSVKDTVGSGDAFLAAFLYQKLAGKTIDETLKYASALAAYVTMNEGACPEYDNDDFQQFLH